MSDADCMFRPERVVVWYSCGAASAVCAKLAIEKYQHKYPVKIVYTDPGYEHPDNERFMADCEKWYGQPVVRLRSDKYKDIYDVFEKTRYLVGVAGARCTTELKKLVRRRYENLNSDIQIFGFDKSEEARAERFRQNNPEVTLETPLIDQGISKGDCLRMIREAGIELPEMYKLGYRNNNCIGCVKGQAGYWNKIRRDFPEVFERMARMEEKIGAAINKRYVKGVRQRVFLRDLPPDMGRYEQEPDISCGILCELSSDANEVIPDSDLPRTASNLVQDLWKTKTGRR